MECLMNEINLFLNMDSNFGMSKKKLEDSDSESDEEANYARNLMKKPGEKATPFISKAWDDSSSDSKYEEDGKFINIVYQHLQTWITSKIGE